MRSRTVHPSLHGTTTPVLPKDTVTFIFQSRKGKINPDVSLNKHQPQVCVCVCVCVCVSPARLQTGFLHQTLQHRRCHDAIERKTDTVSKTNKKVRCLLTRKQCLLNCSVKQHVDDWVRCIATASRALNLI